MMRPSAAEERKIELGTRAKRWARAGLVMPEERERLAAWSTTEWRVFSWPLRIGLFLLTLLAVQSASAFFGFLAFGTLGGSPVHLAAIAVAEVLVVKRRFFRTGIEEALWIAGATGLVADAALFIGMNGGEPGAWLILAAAAGALVAAIRLLQPLFALLSLALVLAWTAVTNEVLPGWTAAAMGMVALAVVALEIEVERPWIARATSWVVVAAPAVAWICFEFVDERTALVWVTAATAIWIAAGIRLRSRAALIGGALAALVAGFKCADALPWPAEGKLLAGGAVAFLVAAGLERVLRTPRRGFTSQAIDREDFGWPAEMVAVAAVAPSAASSDLRGEGGEFGGGGASEKY